MSAADDGADDVVVRVGDINDARYVYDDAIWRRKLGGRAHPISEARGRPACPAASKSGDDLGGNVDDAKIVVSRICHDDTGRPVDGNTGGVFKGGVGADAIDHALSIAGCEAADQCRDHRVYKIVLPDEVIAIICDKEAATASVEGQASRVVESRRAALAVCVA